MAATDLTVEFNLDTSEPFVVSDLESLSFLMQEFSAHLVAHAAENFRREFGLPSPPLLAALPQFPLPAEVTRVSSGSFVVLLTFGAGTVAVWILQNLFGETVKAAWQDSKAEERVRYFLRDRIFGGAKDAVTLAAVRRPSNVFVSAVEELRPGAYRVHVKQHARRRLPKSDREAEAILRKALKGQNDTAPATVGAHP